MKPVITTTDTLAPMSELQRYWWGRERLFPDPGLVMSTPVRVRGALDVAIMEAAVRNVTLRHEAVRTNFGRVDGEPVQIIHRQPPRPVAWLRDISGIPEASRDDILRDLADSEQHRRFDLARDSLVRLGIVRCSQDDFVLLLTVHHIIADGWSLDVLWRDLSEEYEMLSCGDVDRVRTPPPRLRDWVARERAVARSPKAASETEYWNRVLREVRPLHVPHDLVGGSSPARRRPCTRRFTLPQNLGHALWPAAKRYRATPHMITMAAFMKLLARRVQRPDVAVLTLFNRRAAYETADLIGCILNFAVIGVRVPTDGRPESLVRDVRSTLLDAYENQDICAQTLWRRARFSSASVDVMFIFDQHPSRREAVHFGGVPLQPLIQEEEREGEREGAAATAIKFRLELTGKELTGAIGYDANLYSRAFVDAFLEEYVNLLAETLIP
ncbi:condensation domain-containing protein [Streptomyces sp. NRRL S-1022]|uniref:condensation domain-containing protein n=1 Tax=Streptomyces sp. NRRL S-1022 TaxID=1463880 RepID=UPI00131AAE9C|nr:condensation domain-containing protein [Streptomyces sp. NRRL S-1022]